MEAPRLVGTGSWPPSALGNEMHNNVSDDQTVSSDRAAGILGVAAALFREKGYAATTTREIAARLGIKNASLYHHFGSKEDILYRICIDSLVRVESAVREAIEVEGPAEVQVKRLIAAHVVTMLADHDLNSTMLLELRSLSPGRRADVVALRDRYELVVRGVIAEAQQRGYARGDIPPQYISMVLFGALNWLMVWYREDGELSADGLAKLIATLFEEGISPREERGALAAHPQSLPSDRESAAAASTAPARFSAEVDE